MRRQAETGAVIEKPATACQRIETSSSGCVKELEETVRQTH